MADTYPFSGLLVRLPRGSGGSALAAAKRRLSAAGVSFELEPLFAAPATASIDRHEDGAAAAASAFAPPSARAFEWHLARPTGALTGAQAWQVAHEAARAGAALSASPDGLFIEPDFVQDWPYENPIYRPPVPGQPGYGSPAPSAHFSGSLAESAAAAADLCLFNDQNPALPHVDARFAWHLDDDFSQLAAARAQAAGGPIIRIAHLDTGYDPDHVTRPTGLRTDIQRNFVDGQASDDAHDPAMRAPLENPGHGTGTLGILAGGPFAFAGGGYRFAGPLGGAPDAEVVPLRIGSSVVQLQTSSVARGIDYATQLCGDEATRVHVLSMSMGGVASAAWADAVNLAYEAGIVLVTAAGNNISSGFFGFPGRLIVYPARFRRVIAACGVMANRRPYYGLPFGTMQGNWGPPSKMATAMAAYTPNIAWAELGCARLVDMDGQGTSAATPQVAAAAALYLQKHAGALFDHAKYPEAWMRVEAVRQALFASTDRSADGGSPERLGNGILQAARALAEAPVRRELLPRTAADSAVLPFLQVLTGLRTADASSTDAMLALEATQLTQRWRSQMAANPLESAVDDPDQPADAVPPVQMRAFLEGVIEHPDASPALRQRAEEVRLALGGGAATRGRGRGRGPAGAPGVADAPDARDAAGAAGEIDAALSADAVAAAPPVEVPRPAAAPFEPSAPPFRRLRGFSIDPSLATSLETVRISEICLDVPWETVRPGPVGEYLEVIDVDPGSQSVYEPVNLDDPKLLAQNGLPPSEGTPQFHQQMVYAVASLTISNFERALGRRVLWRPGPAPQDAHRKNDATYVPRLRIYPHALRERNAYYSPTKIALLFGYFNASDNRPGDHQAGGMVFTCLSHDVVAHETTHALLDGMHRRFARATNPDVPAFHEAFADIVALLQHFSFPEVLRDQIAVTRGEMRSQQSVLGELAGQFGRTIGGRGALRDAIGTTDEETGVWTPRKPDPADYENETEAHARGGILVAAVFDAFLSIYERRVADLLRLATGGSGLLRPGSIHPDLVNRLAAEAAKAARHVLTMCVRALDYCPPVDITFGEYLRALITADADLVPNDDLHYRVAFIEAFRRRGLYPRDLRTLSVESLRWRGPEQDELRPSRSLEDSLDHLRDFAAQYLYVPAVDDVVAPRERLFYLERAMRGGLHRWLDTHFRTHPDGAHDAAYLGLDPARSFEVHAARYAMRVGPDGQLMPQLLLGLLQEKQTPVDPGDPSGEQMAFEGGSALVVDLGRRKIRYCIRKNLESEARLARQQAFAQDAARSMRATYFGAHALEEGGEPFAALHRRS